jgi:hypothetical protein
MDKAKKIFFGILKILLAHFCEIWQNGSIIAVVYVSI